MKADVILGLQWGDEGKGKIVDLLTPGYDIIARFQGGPNAGHTLEIDGNKHVLHLIPSGIFHERVINLIGNGVIIDPFILSGEIEALLVKGVDPFKNLYVSRRAHLILPTHRLLDNCSESSKKDKKIGSTLKGIGPAYTDKTARNGIRAGDIFSPDFSEKYQALKDHHMKLVRNFNIPVESILIDGDPFETYELKWMNSLETLKKFHFVDGEIFINQALKDGKKVLAEGAQGTLLDIDFGSYPFVTSSNTTIGGVCTGLGIPPSSIGQVFGIFKAYCTRVGNGPFPTELFDENGQRLRDVGREYGSTTGRPRRCGWLDLPALRYSVMINGVDQLIMMKADVLNDFDQINVCTAYKTKDTELTVAAFDDGMNEAEPVYRKFEGWNTNLEIVKDPSDLPEKFKNYIDFIEKETNTQITFISLGPDRNQTVVKNRR
ncbi:MAG: adenylosuccinate synthase [Bacteroidales bacterium]